MDRSAFLELIATMRLNVEEPIKPYKPILVAAVLLLIHKGKITSPRIYLDGALRSTFFQLFDELFPNWPIDTRPKPSNPFRALHSEGLWRLIAKADRMTALEARLEEGAWDVMKHVACAKLDPQLFALIASDPDLRIEAIHTLGMAYRHCLPPNAARRILNRFGPNRVRWMPKTGLTEQVIEEALEQRWKASTFWKKFGVRLANPDVDFIQHRQISTANNNIDLLGYQEGEHRWWVIELKYRDASRDAVAQALSYADWVDRKHAKKEHTVQGIVLTDVVSEPLLGAARQGKVQVWTYTPEDVLKGRLNFQRAA